MSEELVTACADRRLAECNLCICCLASLWLLLAFLLHRSMDCVLWTGRASTRRTAYVALQTPLPPHTAAPRRMNAQQQDLTACHRRHQL